MAGRQDGVWVGREELAEREVYRQKAETHPDDPELVLGQMRCLQALGEWGSVHNISEHYWDSVSVDTRNRMASMATTSAWHTHEWEAMEKYTNLLPREVSASRDCFLISMRNAKVKLFSSRGSD